MREMEVLQENPPAANVLYTFPTCENQVVPARNRTWLTLVNGQLLSPSPTPHVFTRWSTSRLNSTATSTSTSPCGSTRSSFNYRQPYLGWRSQERLSRPRTPAERLAAGLLPAQQTTAPSTASTPDKEPSEEDRRHAQQVPNLSEVRTSIKEVTSAIVHYVSNAKDGSGEKLGLESGQWGDQSSLSLRSNSPRGSGRLCWLESSFVGTRPLDSPETPSTLPGADVETLDALDRHLDGVGKMGGGGELYLDLDKTRPLSRQQRQLNGENKILQLATGMAKIALEKFEAGEEDWNLYGECLEQYFIANDISDDDDELKERKAILILSVKKVTY
ncbi:hypothetical protein PR048_021317 [Dryococelus australis]|uniref:Uncharacterized protein n=1 Tax=Dryococelus australis TaxID=614101 RepID=A0ABQ9GXY5_9NEOP|nr:hypothetical protein PR048_021317 [Dryococelus australis]